MTDVLAILALFVSTVALASVYFAWKAVTQTRKWEKIKCVPLFLDARHAYELLETADAELNNIGIAANGKITADEAERIWKCPKCKKAVTRLLTYYERFAAAVHVGAVDRDFAYHLAVGEIVGVNEKYRLFIDYKKAILNDPEVLAGLSTLAQSWSMTVALRRDGALRESKAASAAYSNLERL